MNKGLKILFGVLLFLILILAMSTGFFLSKTLSLQKKNNSTPAATTSTSTTKNVTDHTTSSTPSTATTAAPLGNRPSSPSDTVTVAQGQTLFQIGQTVGVSWTVLAEANGINADAIKAGQMIIVPKNNQVAFTINQDKAKSLQASVDNGQFPFRLSPIETAKSDCSPVYGLVATDTFSQKTLDINTGSATVLATHGDKTYLISLVQPQTKGAKGIWAIESVKPQT